MEEKNDIAEAELVLRDSIRPIEMDYTKIRASKKQEIVSGSRKRRVYRKRLIKNLWGVFSTYRNPRKIIRVFKLIRHRKKIITGGDAIIKVVKVANRHHWRLSLPAWDSPFFERFMWSELGRLEPHARPTYRLNLAYLAITKKCPLKCEHCFEWDNLNQKEKIRTSDIDAMIENLQSIGTFNIAFTGGEPMLRIKEIISAVHKYKEQSAFWILTSGFNFTPDNASALKDAGLYGVVVSIDHFDAYQHDLFRRTEGSYRDALQAVKLGIENDFLTAISTCLTRATATREYLDQFMLFAKDLGVGFVQLLEPKAIGHYAAKDVVLKPEQIQLLEEVFLAYNLDPAYIDFPIIVYHGYYQRRLGCMASGSRMVYVDTNGDFLSCPFCHEKKGSLLDANFANSIEEMNLSGCVDYGSFD